MALFNYATKEITLKIVYYGPGLSGKTTNLQYLHAALNPEKKGKLLSLSTESERTLFFDFLPIELGKIREFSIRFQLYTVPGQVRYNATRKVVLKGADAVVFVADSQEEMREQNVESIENMRENLISNNINPDTIPIILQYNKRDLKNILGMESLNKDLNPQGSYEVLESVAIDGRGVEDTFKRITRLLLKDISRKHKIEIPLPEEVSPAAAPAEPAPKAPPEPVWEEVKLDRKPEKIDLPLPEAVKMSEFETSLRLKDISKKYKIEIPLPEEVSPAAAPAEPAPKAPPEPVWEEVKLDKKPEKIDLPLPETVKMSEFETSLLLKDISRRYKSEIPLPEEIIPAPAPVEPAPKAPPEPVREEVKLDSIIDKIHRLMSETETIAEFVTGAPVPQEAEPEDVPAHAPGWTDAIEDAKPAEPIAVTMHLPEAAAAPETAEDIFFPRSEEAIEEERSSFREEQTAEMPADVEAVSAEPAPAKKMDEFSKSISDLSDRVGSISDAIDLLRQTVSDLKGEVKSLRGEIALTNLRADKGPELKDSQKLDELKREQKRISEFVTDIVDVLHTIKEKKSWFKF